MEQKLRESIYNESKKLEQELARLKESDLTEKNKKSLRDFFNSATARGLSKHRIMMYLARLRNIGLILGKDFKKADRRDMERVVAEIRNKNYSPNTISTVLRITKSYFRWLYGCDRSDSAPEPVKWIVCENVPNRLEKEDLLTTEEVTKIINAADSLQWKALISTIVEGALRPAEAISTTLKDVFVNTDHIKLRVAGKMEKKYGKRDVYLFNSYDLIVRWIDSHPLKEDKDAPLFVVKNGSYKSFSIEYLNMLIKRLAKKAGITKPVRTYLLRHTRGTALVKKHGTAIAQRVMGHKEGSKTIATYTHLGDSDILEALSGKKQEEEELTMQCDRCKHYNGYGSSRCSNCGLSFDVVELDRQKKERRDEIVEVMRTCGMQPMKI